MSTIKSLATSSLILGACLSLAACSSDLEAGAPTQAGAAQTSVSEEQVAAVDSSIPDLASVAARAKARWETIVAQDWIQAYDYMTPERRQIEKLGSFLNGKEHNEYRNPSAPFLLGSDGDEAYIEFSVLWQTHHPQIVSAANNPGDLTQELNVIETWTWQDGEWYWVNTERQKEFLDAHPDVGKEPGE